MLLKTQRRSLYLHQKSTPNSPFSLVTPHVFSIQRELRVSKVRGVKRSNHFPDH